MEVKDRSLIKWVTFLRLLKFDLSLVTLQALKNFPGKIEKSKILQIELVLIRLNFSVLFQKSSREFE